VLVFVDRATTAGIVDGALIRYHARVPSTDTRPTLTIVCYAGLCNRLMALVSGAALAEATNRHFRMIWPSTDACAATFDRLFSAPWNIVPDSDAGDALENGYRAWRSGPPDLTAEPRVDVSFLAGGTLLFPDVYPHHARWMQEAMASIEMLAPHPALQGRIEEFAGRHFRSSTIGVHIRRGDFVRRQPDVVANTNLVIREIDRRLEQSPDATVFLCTDDGGPDQVTGRRVHEGVREHLRRRYGPRVIWTTPRTLDRRDPIAIEDAVVDLWLLRRTSAIVGTSSSTFSLMAALGRDVDTVMCGAPARGYVHLERLARMSGLDTLLRAIPLRSRPGPGAPFAAVWSYYAALPRAFVRRLSGRGLSKRP
jgi:hypothetical protein